MVFTSAALVGLAGVFRGEAALYDPAADQLFLQPRAVHPVGTTILLDDGRAFGIERRDSSQDPFNTGIFVQIYTPPPYTNPVPRIGSVISNNAPASQALALDIRGESFLPNSSAWLGSNKLVTLYLGSQHLAAFVPPSLRS